MPDARSWRYKLLKLLTSPVLTLGEVNYSALQVLQLVALTVGLWFGVSALTRLFKSSVLLRTGADAGVQDVVAVLTQYVLALAPLGEKLAAIDIEALVKAMRELGGLEIKDRRHRLNLYPCCFVGSEAVEWVMRTQNCTREEAINIGQLLVDRGIIHHVTDEHPFQDDFFFYRFYTDEQGVST